MNTKENRSVRRTKRALAQAFVQLAQDKPARSITVGELTEAADVSRSTFYTHYHDVFELRESIGAELLEDCEQRFRAVLATRTPHPDDLLDSPMLVAICTYIAQNAPAFRLMLGENGDPAFRRNLEGYIRRDVLESMEDLYGSIPASYAESYCVFAASGCIGVVADWLTAPAPAAPETVASHLGRMLKGAARSLT